MAEQSEEPKYIICSKCHCKYINDEENIKIYFGHKRLGDRYKTCVKCRTRKPIASTSSSSTDTEFTKKVYDIRTNPFVNEKDIINSCHEYGYNTIELPDSFTLCFEGQKVLEDIYDTLINSKSICIFKYNKSSEVVERFMEGLGGADNYVKENCIVACFIQNRNIVSLVFEFVNAFEYMFTNLKLQHPRRCSICYEKSKHRKICFRCNKDICNDCFMKLNKLSCPNCLYSITEHWEHMETLYQIKE